jgi:predicted alpha/beta hydrolase
MMTADTLDVRADDGAELRLWRTTVARSPGRQVPILLVHGTFSNRAFFGGHNGLAQYLADRGYDTWVAELRGRSSGHRPHWGFEDWIVSDAPALLCALCDATGSPRVLWIGHSAGGIIAAGCGARSDANARMLAGIILLAAPAPDRPGPWHAMVAAVGSVVGRLAGRFPARALRIGPADEGPGILRQWSGWNLRQRWVGRDGFDYLGGAKQVSVPALAVAGAGDLLAPPSSCRRLLDALGGDDHTLMICGRDSGFSRNYTHNRLVISSDAREEIWPRIAGWIEERYPR